MDPNELKKLLETAVGLLATAERLRPGQNRTAALQLIRGFASEVSLYLDRCEFGDHVTLHSPSTQDFHGCRQGRGR
jgi:hypothetical protein